jgi:hypothetical protein
VTFEPEKFFSDLRQVDVTIPMHPKNHLPTLFAGDTINNTVIRLYFHEEDQADLMHFLSTNPDVMIAIWSGDPPLVKDVYEYKGSMQL